MTVIWASFAAVAVFAFVRSGAMAKMLLVVTENPMTAVGTLLAVSAAVALMFGSVNNTNTLRSEIGGVRTVVDTKIGQTNARIDQTNTELQGVRTDVNERIDQTNTELQGVRTDVNERIAEGFAQISKEIRSLRPSQDTADQ